VEIELKECPVSGNQSKSTFHITPYQAGDNEMMTVELDKLCTCDCETEDAKVSKLIKL